MNGSSSRFAIDVQDLAKTYRSGPEPIEAVRGVDLRIGTGEIVALLGPNGAGKSTTVDMLLGLQEPDRGRATLFGGPPAAATSNGKVGAMLQDGGVLAELTVRELVAMIATLFPAPLDVAAALDLAQLTQLAARRTERLSGGEAQRLRFAVAIVSNPDLLLLDEPTTGMDVESRRAFWATVRDLAATGKTILFATHYLDEADAYADRVILMASGRVVADGPPTALKAIVGSRTIRATLPRVEVEELERLPAVTAAQRHGEVVALVSSDSDKTLRALLETYADARDIEVRGAGLEEAFLQLTSGAAEREATP